MVIRSSTFRWLTLYWKRHHQLIGIRHPNISMAILCPQFEKWFLQKSVLLSYWISSSTGADRMVDCYGSESCRCTAKLKWNRAHDGIFHSFSMNGIYPIQYRSWCSRTVGWWDLTWILNGRLYQSVIHCHAQWVILEMDPHRGISGAAGVVLPILCGEWRWTGIPFMNHPALYKNSWIDIQFGRFA